MNHHCGLVDRSNPCRCFKKTRAFIAAGVVDPEHLRFYRSHVLRVKDVVGDRARELEEWLELFSEHPFPAPSDLPEGQDWMGLLADAGR